MSNNTQEIVNKIINDTFKNVTRFEVIDESGRALVRRGIKVELSLQDEERTLKVFLTSKP